MDCDDEDNSVAQPGDEESRSAVNSLILDYYKKFGRKRDLEQYFSLSTAQSDIRDPSSPFWRSMKTEESEDSGERSDKKSESSQELCRISIRCSVPDPSSTSQDEDCKTKTESVSPPIIIEEISHDSRQNSEDDALRSDDNHSQKSFDVMLDTSTNKPLSPSSSITSQRKLEWDSLADVGYANESDRKTSASSLSTLERLALKQQYSNNDTQPSDIGPPTSHSTPLEDERQKIKKGVGKKSTKIHKKDVDFLEVNVPHSSSSTPSINVNLTKHISFNVEKDGKVTLESVQKDVSVSPEKVPIEEVPMGRIDKEIQTSLLKTKESSTKPENPQSQKIPILIGLNTLKRTRRKRFRMARRKLKTKKKSDKANTSGRERSVTEQLSEAESFEYMPGHIYNQNQMTANERLSGNIAGNKSSLESSAAHTTDSSKGSKHSFTKDLEKGIDLLNNAFQHRCDDAELKRKLIKQVCQRLLNSQYRDDDSTTDFLSGLSFGSKKLGLDHHTTTSTSEGNNSAEKSKRPKKSILRADKFNPGSIASTSQSAPNLPVASKSDKLVTSNLTKTFTSSNTDSDLSSKDKTSSDNAGPKVTSEALYQKYLQALKREEAYKRHLKDKEMFLRQKLVCSDSAFQVPARVEVKANDRLKDLINDLTRNNYDDGSGDASKLEGGPGSSRNFDRPVPNRNQRSHSVFTLSSGNSDAQKKQNLKKRLQCEVKDLSKPGTSKETKTHYCCCPHHSGTGKMAVADSSVQVNIQNPCTDENSPNRERISPRQGQTVTPIHLAGTNDRFGDIKFVCHCQTKNALNNAQLYNNNSQFPSNVQPYETSNEVNVYPCQNQNCPYSSRIPCNDKYANIKSCAPNLQIKRQAKSSQTNMLLKFLRRKSSDPDFTSSVGRSSQDSDKNDAIVLSTGQSIIVYESTRCIQTEISINPRIAEPTLSDINIVNERECVKVISEHCRKSSKPSITNIFVSQNDAETCTNSDSIKSSGTSNNGGNDFLDDAQSQTNDVCETYNIAPHSLNTNKKNKTGNFTIPIQGTNMTLLVSVGSERGLMGNKVEGFIPVSTGISEQATSFTGESSQRERGYSVDHNSNRTGQPGSSEIIKFDSNPKRGVIAQRSQSFDINDNIDTERQVQTDEINKRDAQTQENVPIETQTPGYLLEPDKNLESVSKNVQCNTVIPLRKNVVKETKKNETCLCGCEGIKENCREDCAGNCNPREPRGILLPRESQTDLELDKQINTDNLVDNLHEKSLRKQISTQSSFDKLNEKCPCGCDGIKEDCRKDCAGQTGTPRESCRKRSVDKQSSTQNVCNKLKEKCPCGCDGIKENCKKDCAGRTETSGDLCEKETVFKKSCKKQVSLEQHDQKCLCGCAEIVEDCDEDCVGRVLKPREPCTETVLFSNQEKCLCGCGGTKDNCQKNCEDVPVTPRDGCIKHSQKNDVIPVSPRERSIKKSYYIKKSQPMKPFSRSDPLDNRKQSLENKTSGGSESHDERNDGDGKSSLNEPRSPKLASNRLLETHEQETNTEYEECPCNLRGNCKQDCSYSRTASKNKPFTSCSDKKDVGVQKRTAIISKENDTVNSREEHAYNKTRNKSNKSSSEAEQTDTGSDPILNLIQDITRRYSKNDIEKNKRKKCFTEIVLALNYLLETDDCIEGRGKVAQSSTTPDDSDLSNKRVVDKPYCKSSPKKAVDKGVQLPRKLSKTRASLTQCSEVPTSDNPTTSSDSAACKILNKIKKECEKYHQKRCKVHCGKKCDASSSTSINCEHCRRVHHCACRSNKCKGQKKSTERIQKGAIAYNLILQTSESMMSEGTVCNEKSCQLKNIIVKVPKRKPVENIPFKEMAYKFERNMPPSSPRNLKSSRSRSLPNESEISSMDEIMRKSRGCTVREYLEKNRPDFVERSSQRQNCLRYVSECRAPDQCSCTPNLKMIVVHTPNCMESPNMFCTGVPMCQPQMNNQCYDPGVAMYQSGVARIGEFCANEREVQRDMLAMYMAELPDVTTLDSDGLRNLASDLGKFMRKKRPAPKFISEREMKKHSEKIYKSLPEVVRKKEEIKKENIKKTNLLMASIFKKNLQKKTLRGSVNLSNYSTVVQI